MALLQQCYNMVERSRVDLFANGRKNLGVSALRMHIVSKAGDGGGCCGGSSDPNKLTIPKLEYNILEESTGSSCCSSGGSSQGSSCSSHSNNSGKAAGLENVGKEFEALVAQQTMLEMEKQFNLKEMEGKISKDIMQEAMNSAPLVASSAGENCIDVGQLLNEVGSSDFLFDEDLEDIVLV